MREKFDGAIDHMRALRFKQGTIYAHAIGTCFNHLDIDLDVFLRNNYDVLTENLFNVMLRDLNIEICNYFDINDI